MQLRLLQLPLTDQCCLLHCRMAFWAGPMGGQDVFTTLVVSSCVHCCCKAAQSARHACPVSRARPQAHNNTVLPQGQHLTAVALQGGATHDFIGAVRAFGMGHKCERRKP